MTQYRNGRLRVWQKTGDPNENSTEEETLKAEKLREKEPSGSK